MCIRDRGFTLSYLKTVTWQAERLLNQETPLEYLLTQYQETRTQKQDTQALEKESNELTYNYVDGAITMPQASGDGMNGYVVLGLSVAGLAVTMFTCYAIYYGKVRKKRRAGRRK